MRLGLSFFASGLQALRLCRFRLYSFSGGRKLRFSLNGLTFAFRFGLNSRSGVLKTGAFRFRGFRCGKLDSIFTGLASFLSFFGGMYRGFGSIFSGVGVRAHAPRIYCRPSKEKHLQELIDVSIIFM